MSPKGATYQLDPLIGTFIMARFFVPLKLKPVAL